MPSTTTTIARTEQMASGEQKSVWGTRANRVFRFQEEAFGAYKTVNMTDDDKTLTPGTFSTDGEARAAVLNITGNLTQARNLNFPNSQKTYYVRNSTGQTLNLKSGTSSAIELPHGVTAPIYTTGANGIHFALNYLPELLIDDVVHLGKDGSNAAISIQGDRDLVINENGVEALKVSKTQTTTKIEAGSSITFQNDNILFAKSDGTGINMQTIEGFGISIQDLIRRVTALENA